MKNFLSVNDVSDLHRLLNSAEIIKQDPFGENQIGKGKYLGLIFLNPSLRTRLSTQRAAHNLGMEVMIMNMAEEGWKIENSDGVVMEGDSAEHIKEAAAVLGKYCEIIGIRTFPHLKDRDEDYNETTLNKLVQYSGRPVISLESSIRHPLQSFADIMTIEELKTGQNKKPRVVMSWAPHPRALPQSVPNSFSEWVNKMEYDFIVTHPVGYELDESFVDNSIVEYNQEKAFEGADFIYMKNWSSYRNYGQIASKDKNWTLTLTKLKNTNNAKVMHCLPVRRNMIIADDVLDSSHSIVIREAENRIYTAQAVLKQILMDNF